MSDRNSIAVERLQYPDAGTAFPDCWSNLPRLDNLLNQQARSKETVAASPAKAAATISSEDLERKFEAGRTQGIEEGREIERQAQAERLREMERSKIVQAANALEQFAAERARFFTAIEPDVVSLALSIAERVLRREAQIDALLLMGSVRVALGQLAENVQVRVRVPASESQLWTDTLAHLPNLKNRPEIAPDSEMQLGECRLESEMGSVDLGLEAQIRSIKHGLLDQAAAARHPAPALHKEGKP